MSASALQKIEAFDEDELKTFLKNNGMDGSIKYFALRELNGRAFLNLANPEPTGWKNLVPISELAKVRKFIEDVKENPDVFLKQSEEPFRIQNQFSYFEEMKEKLSDNGSAEKDQDLEELSERLQTMLDTDDYNDESSKLSNLPKRESRNKHTTSYMSPSASNQFEEHGTHTDMPDNVQGNIKAVSVKNRIKNIDSKYYLEMNRKEAENFLRTCYLDGTYLFRPSSQHYCALSVLFENEVHHFPIESIGGRRLELVTLGDSLQFNSLEEIVRYLKLHPVLRIAELKKNIRLSNPFLQSK